MIKILGTSSTTCLSTISIYSRHKSRCSKASSSLREGSLKLNFKKMLLKLFYKNKTSGSLKHILLNIFKVLKFILPYCRIIIVLGRASFLNTINKATHSFYSSTQKLAFNRTSNNRRYSIYNVFYCICSNIDSGFPLIV